MALPPKIFLVGLPASGKSTLGRRLASLLGYPFIDLDEAIEKSENMKIGDIFSKKGEDHFRMVEHYTLKDVIARHPKFIMATGGGTPCNYENMGLINKAGKSVFIDTTLEKIANRLATSTHRPMFNTTDKEQILLKLQDLQKERLKYYREAHFTTSGNSPEAILELVKN